MLLAFSQLLVFFTIGTVIVLVIIVLFIIVTVIVHHEVNKTKIYLSRLRLCKYYPQTWKWDWYLSSQVSKPDTENFCPSGLGAPALWSGHYTEFDNVAGVAGSGRANFFTICAKFWLKSANSANFGLFAQSLSYEWTICHTYH